MLPTQTHATLVATERVQPTSVAIHTDDASWNAVATDASFGGNFFTMAKHIQKGWVLIEKDHNGKEQAVCFDAEDDGSNAGTTGWGELYYTKEQAVFAARLLNKQWGHKAITVKKATLHWE
jgi:hypothetical protein